MMSESMGSPAFVAQLQIKRRWRSLTAIALFVAIVGGIAIALIAGARRSSSVVHRYFGATIPYDLLVGSYQDLTRTQLLAIPGVVRADIDTYFASTEVHPDGSLGDGINGELLERSSIDPTIRVIEGRLPDPGDDRSILVNESFTQKFGLRSGDELTVKTFAPSDLDAVQANHYDHPHGPEYRFRVAAVVRTPVDVALDLPRSPDGAASSENNAAIFVLQPFHDRNHGKYLGFGDAYDIQLAPSTSRSAFEAAAKRLAGGTAYFGPARFAERRAAFDTPVDLETTALLTLGSATALAGAVVTGLLLGANQRANEDDDDLLRALGMTRQQLGFAAALRTAPFAVTGAVLAVALAFALSGRFPIGVGHLLELNRGRNANVAVLVIALAVTLLFVVATAFGLACRAHHGERPAPARARGSVARALGRNGAPAEIVVGTHFAFSDGRRGSSTRPAIVGGAVALAVVVALATFVAGTDHLYSNGAAHGWPWDAVIGNTNFTASKGRQARILHDPRVVAGTSARYGQATVGGRSTELLAYDPEGTAPPIILSGRHPTHADEIAPGAKLLRQLHAHVGDRLKLSVADGEFAPTSGRTHDRQLTVVGVSLPPVMGESDFGDVAIVTLSAIRSAGGIADPQLVLTRLRGDPAGTANGLAHDYTPDVLLDNVPARVVNLHRVDSLPALGALIAALFGTMLLAYTLAVSARRRTRQLGVLRALGMNGRRVSRALAWQGVALALTITIIGLPLGIALGSVLWRSIAHQLGTPPRATIPTSVLLVIPAAIVVGALAAVIPARRARRQHISELLRTE